VGLPSVAAALSSKIPTGLLVDCLLTAAASHAVQHFFSCSYLSVRGYSDSVL